MERTELDGHGEELKEAEGYLIYNKKNGKYGYCGITIRELVLRVVLDTGYNLLGISYNRC